MESSLSQLTDALLNMLFNHVTMSPRSCLPMYGKAFKKVKWKCLFFVLKIHFIYWLIDLRGIRFALG